ncbi:hypothetical protein BCL90_4226 [Pedobacter alluvionis]|uniref:Uncharacterized protein n=1 Tax=Pedobacter alluvionis TaxID=475253 RepID=A0A497XT74_9SPHI|nr:hypothetical protein BCL90_4226 [Pedobacter alluvionis]
MKAHSDDGAKTYARMGRQITKEARVIKIDVKKAQVRRRLRPSALRLALEWVIIL